MNSKHANRIRKDIVSSYIMRALMVFACMLVILMILALLFKANPVLRAKPFFELIFSSLWHPMKGQFGFLPFIAGTLWITLIAVIIAVPPAILTSVFLSIYAPSYIRKIFKPFIDLLAGIPSVIYGVWGVLVIVPFIRNIIAPLFRVSSSGYTALTGGIVLSVMILPIIIHISVEVLSTVPRGLNEASLSLGSTQWQSVKYVLMRKGLPGIIAAIVLGLSRAFGETMAVMMVAGNVVKIPSSPLDPAYALPALIANNYGEMLSIPLYDSALMLAALILMIVILFFNIISRLILIRVNKSIA